VRVHFIRGMNQSIINNKNSEDPCPNFLFYPGNRYHNRGKKRGKVICCYKYSLSASQKIPPRPRPQSQWSVDAQSLLHLGKGRLAGAPVSLLSPPRQPDGHAATPHAVVVTGIATLHTLLPRACCCSAAVPTLPRQSQSLHYLKKQQWSCQDPWPCLWSCSSSCAEVTNSRQIDRMLPSFARSCEVTSNGG